MSEKYNYWNELGQQIKVLRDKHLSPESEFVTGATATLAYAVILFNPDTLPAPIASLLKQFRESIPAFDMFLAASGILAAALSLDGANRIVDTRFPTAKAAALSIAVKLIEKIHKG